MKLASERLKGFFMAEATAASEFGATIEEKVQQSLAEAHIFADSEDEDLMQEAYGLGEQRDYPDDKPTTRSSLRLPSGPTLKTRVTPSLSRPRLKTRPKQRIRRPRIRMRIPRRTRMPGEGRGYRGSGRGPG